jgi:hypothetical protein
MGVSRSIISLSEKHERLSGITIKTLEKIAEAMGGRAVYGIVFEKEVDEILMDRVIKKATNLVDEGDIHISLEYLFRQKV